MIDLKNYGFVKYLLFGSLYYTEGLLKVISVLILPLYFLEKGISPDVATLIIGIAATPMIIKFFWGGIVDSFIQRGRKIKRVLGGNAGFLYSLLLRLNFLPYLKQRFINIFFPFYDWLSRLGILRKIIPWKIQPQVYTFQTNEGLEMQLFLGKTPIGRRVAGQQTWQIRRPFRLIIDESSLP